MSKNKKTNDSPIAKETQPLMGDQPKIVQPSEKMQELIKSTDLGNIQISAEEKALEHKFWRPKMIRESSVNPEGQIYKEEKGIGGVEIDYIDFYEFLYSEGFRRFEFNEEVFYIKIVNGRVLKRVKMHHIQDCVTIFIKSLPEVLTHKKFEYSSRLILQAWIQKQDALLSDKRLSSQLRSREHIHFISDTIDTKYMYFLNGYLSITADKILFKKYDILKGFIWESQQIKRDFKFPIVDEKKDYIKQFFLNVSGNNPTRFLQLTNIAGYLMHNFVAYKRKGIVLTDSVIDPEGNANGRSGKSLWCEIVGGAISSDPRDPAIKSFININGKDFDTADKNKYSSADIDTKLIVINDLKNYFLVDQLFNDITEGLNVDKKFLLPFRIEPKIILTTNKTISIEGASAKDRFIEFEFSDHYNENHSPEDEFGHWFFTDWTNEDYCRYYLFMANCARQFFKDGKLARPDSINLNRRKLIETTDHNFLDFIENDWQPKDGHLYEKNEITNLFLIQFPDYNKPGSKFSQNKFSGWVKRFMNYSPQWENYNPKINEVRKADTQNQTRRYYKFIKKQEK